MDEENEEEAPAIEWAPANEEANGETAEGELELVIPAIPAAGVAKTTIKARGTRASAARQLARKAERLLSSSAVQSVLPPQARVALEAARKLGSLAKRAKKLRKWLPW